MRYPMAFTMMLMPVAAVADEGSAFHLHPHGAESAVAGIGLLALTAALGALLFRGRR